MEKNLNQNWVFKNLNTFISFSLGIFILFVASAIMLFFKEIYIVGLALIIVEIVLFIVTLFIKNISIFYKIKFSEEGFSITKFSKEIDNIKWNEIVSLQVIDKFKMGKFIQVATRDGKKLLIEYRNKIKDLFKNYCPEKAVNL